MYALELIIWKDILKKQTILWKYMKSGVIIWEFKKRRKKLGKILKPDEFLTKLSYSQSVTTNIFEQEQQQSFF